MRTILAVDDSASMRQILAFTLKDAGYRVVEAADGEDALEKASHQAIDLVITDHNMPHMDGLILTRSLRSMPQYQKVPILILTTESGAEIKAQGKAAGANGWMVKPFEPKLLLEAMKRMLG